MPTTSAARTLNFEETFETRISEIDHLVDSDPPSSPILGTAEPAPKQMCLDESKYVIFY